jgi:hypothetical protein
MSGARRFQVASVLWLLPLTVVVPPAYACRCGDPPVCEAFWGADAVFIGVADIINPKEQRTRFRVEEAFRGVRRDEIIEVLSYGVCWSCEYGFQQANRYLVFATKRPTGERAGLCSRIKPFENASTDIAFARIAVAETKRQGRVYGTAWISSEGPLLEEATVKLQGTGYTATKPTNDRGQFEFDRVPPGRCRLAIVPPVAFDRPTAEIRVNGPGACVRHVFNLSRTSREKSGKGFVR